jgi:ribonuclease HII
MRYGALLGATFPGARVTTLAEAPIRSEYVVADAAGRRAHVTFAEKSESFSFPVALASCAAKYAREACMHAFNAYFQALEPALTPTAGYVTDARRWLADAEHAIARSGLPRDAIVRAR